MHFLTKTTKNRHFIQTYILLIVQLNNFILKISNQEDEINPKQ